MASGPPRACGPAPLRREETFASWRKGGSGRSRPLLSHKGEQDADDEGQNEQEDDEGDFPLQIAFESGAAIPARTLAARRHPPTLPADAARRGRVAPARAAELCGRGRAAERARRSEEHTSELQSLANLVCGRRLEKKNR